MSLCDDLSRLKQRAQELAVPVPCTRCRVAAQRSRICARCGGQGYIERDRVEALVALVEDLIETVAGLAASAA